MTTPDTLQSSLRAIERALSQEAHVLSGWPSMTWQQLHNRLCWGDERLTDRLTAFANHRRTSPWLRSLSPPTEDAALERTLVGHSDAVTACAFSPDGQLIVSASKDGTLKIWDRETGEERLTLEGHSRDVLACAFSPDGDRIASAGEDLVRRRRRSRATPSAEAVRVWDSRTGAEIRTIAGHVPTGGRSNVYVRDCAFSPDGRWIASAGSDNSLRIWDEATGEEIMSLEDHPTSVVSCAFSPDGRMIVSACAGGRAGKQRQPSLLKIWDTASGREIRTLVGHTHGVSACAFSPDGRLVMAAGLELAEVEDGSGETKSELVAGVKVWDVGTGEEVRNLTGGEGRRELQAPNAFDGAWSPDNSLIAAAKRDGTVTLWRAESGDRIASLTGHSAEVSTCAFSPDGQSLASAGWDATLKIWDIGAEAAQGAAADRHIGSVHSCEFGLGGRCVVSAARDDSVIRLWDDNGVLLDELTGHQRVVDHVALSPDGRYSVSSGWDKTLRIWDLETGVLTGTVKRRFGGIATGGCSFSPDGRQILFFANGDKALRVFATDSGDELDAVAQHAVAVRGFAFDPNGQTIVTAGEDDTADGKLIHTVKVWDAATGNELQLLEEVDHTGRVTSCRFTPDGRSVITTSEKSFHGGDVAIWDAATGDELARLTEGRKASAVATATSPDGRWLATIWSNGTLETLDLASCTDLWKLRGFSAGPCRFTPDGRMLLATRRDSSLAILDAETGTEIARLPDAGARSLSIHPQATRFTVGDEIGGVRVFDMVGIAHGPPVVTGVDLGNGREIRCPHCGRMIPWRDEYRGRELRCPHTDPECGGSLSVNPFAVGEQV